MPNLKQMVQRGQRQSSKQALLEILEFGTSLGPDFSPRNELRQSEQWLKFIAHRHQIRGNKLRDLTSLPQEWDKVGNCGVYNFEVSATGKIMIWQSKFGVKKALPAKYAKAITDRNSLRIQSNFSETSATLVESDPKGIYYNMVCSFPDHIVGQDGFVDGSTGGTPELEKEANTAAEAEGATSGVCQEGVHAEARCGAEEARRQACGGAACASRCSGLGRCR